MTKVYGVKASPAITNMRRGIGSGAVAGTRRRGGVVFGSEATLLSVDAGPDGVLQVTKEQLAAILADHELDAVEMKEPEKDAVGAVSAAGRKRKAKAGE